MPNMLSMPSQIKKQLPGIRSKLIKMSGFLTTLMMVVILFSSYASPAGAASASKVSLPPPVPCPGCWQPALNTSWQWQLSGKKVDQSFNVVMYDIDMFDNPASVVQSLHAAGRIVICYIDAGTWEKWRPDAKEFPKSVLGKPNGWPGERWLDIRQLSILGPIMQARMQLCQSKGFDGIEFDNVDGYSNKTGFPLTYQDQLTYDVWLVNSAHTLGLSVALKNDVDQVNDLLPYFDWSLDEQCFQYKECDKLLPFINAGKAVMEVEYKLNPSQFCAKANAMNFNSMKKHLNLGPYRVACR
ncbi:MAG TPA: endo alpha-1,4 polygalactosaminidase [Ktedonobacteraceae bacterium]|nr:endo alpha-1,4 polygalactosaminidase [Ktedonobacteraceae bacterium]